MLANALPSSHYKVPSVPNFGISSKDSVSFLTFNQVGGSETNPLDILLSARSGLDSIKSDTIKSKHL